MADPRDTESGCARRSLSPVLGLRCGHEDAATVDCESHAGGRLVHVTDRNGTVIRQGSGDLDRLVGRDVTLGRAVGGDPAEDLVYRPLDRLTEAKVDDLIVRAREGTVLG